MPGYPLTAATILTCIHQAPAVLPATQTAVSVLGAPVITAAGKIGVMGCLFAPGGVAQPCTEIRWTGISAKVAVQGKPMLLMPPPGTGPGPGVCLGPAPQGIPAMKRVQIKVTAT